MPKHVFKKLSREFKIFVNSITVTKLWKCYSFNTFGLLMLFTLKTSTAPFPCKQLKNALEVFAY